MYLFTKDGILSIVAHTDRPGALMVRAVTRKDLVHFWPGAKITKTTDADYYFRTVLPRQEVALRLAHAIAEIDYPKVKPSVGKDRAGTFPRAWSILMDLQDQLTVRP